ncbi:MAG: HAD family phosphatase [Oscillibacter sp.]|nr:HAD family phosphatase [Oscillibacter sp.]
MRLQSAIFDMDGTLLDSMPMWHTISDNFVRLFGQEPEANLWEDIKPLSVAQTVVYYKEHYHMEPSTEELAVLFNNQVRDFYTYQVKCKPGVEKFLSLMKMEGVWMYVATATDRDLVEAALKCAGIDGYFRGIATCGDVGVDKVHSPAVFKRALTRLQSNKKDTVIFEDSLPAIKTAKAAGFRCAGVYDSEWEADQAELKAVSDYYIRSFEEMFDSRSFLD